MARKKGDKMTATETETKFVRLELPIEAHTAFRVEAAKRGTTMATLAREIVEEFLSRQKGAK